MSIEAVHGVQRSPKSSRVWAFPRQLLDRLIQFHQRLKAVSLYDVPDLDVAIHVVGDETPGLIQDDPPIQDDQDHKDQRHGAR